MLWLCISNLLLNKIRLPWNISEFPGDLIDDCPGDRF